MANLPVQCYQDEEVHAVIRFLTARHVAPIEIYRQIVQVYGEGVRRRQSVAKWCEDFNVGTTDCARSDRPTTANTSHKKSRAETGTVENRKVTPEAGSLDEELEGMIPFEKVKLECPEVQWEPEGAYDVSTVKVEPIEEITVEDHNVVMD